MSFLKIFLVIQESNSYRRNFKNSDGEKFKVDIKAVSWNDLLKDNKNVNDVLKKFFTTLNDVLDSHVPFIKVTKEEPPFQSEPWFITEMRRLM